MGIYCRALCKFSFCNTYGKYFIFWKIQGKPCRAGTCWNKWASEQEFENLKSQVNPHFLFNCFNTLSSLIQEDKKEAEKFLDELSKVYRYLLTNNEDGVSTVEKEVKFLESYYRLLKTRYGDGLHINIEIDKRYYPYLLPSLSLQLLVENAVKHNVVSRQKPLTIEVFTAAGNKLVVNNNLQRKQLNRAFNPDRVE